MFSNTRDGRSTIRTQQQNTFRQKCCDERHQRGGHDLSTFVKNREVQAAKVQFADFVLLRILPVYYIRVMDNVLSLMVPLMTRVFVIFMFIKISGDQ